MGSSRGCIFQCRELSPPMSTTLATVSTSWCECATRCAHVSCIYVCISQDQSPPQCTHVSALLRHIAICAHSHLRGLSGILCDVCPKVDSYRPRCRCSGHKSRHVGAYQHHDMYTSRCISPVRYIHAHTCIYIYIYICVCRCMGYHGIVVSRSLYIYIYIDGNVKNNEGTQHVG